MNPKLLLVYQGRQGQWDGMGRTLYEREALFRDTIIRASDFIGERDGLTLRDAYESDEAAIRVNQNEYHAILMHAALHCALTDLWRSKGLRMHGTIGLSLGDITSTYANGVLSLEDTMLVAKSGALWDERLSNRGKIIILQQSLAETQKLIAACPEKAECFAEFGPTTTLLFVTREREERVLQFLNESQTNHLLYDRDSAYHTREFESCERDVITELAKLPFSRQKLPFYSSFVGGRVPDDHNFDASHFYKMLAGRVHFNSAFEHALMDGFNIILNIGPHPALASYQAEAACKLDREIVILDSMRNDEKEIDTIKQSSLKLKELRLLN